MSLKDAFSALEHDQDEFAQPIEDDSEEALRQKRLAGAKEPVLSQLKKGDLLFVTDPYLRYAKVAEVRGHGVRLEAAMLSCFAGRRPNPQTGKDEYVEEWRPTCWEEIWQVVPHEENNPNVPDAKIRWKSVEVTREDRKGVAATNACLVGQKVRVIPASQEEWDHANGKQFEQAAQSSDAKEAASKARKVG